MMSKSTRGHDLKDLIFLIYYLVTATIMSVNCALGGMLLSNTFIK